MRKPSRLLMVTLRVLCGLIAAHLSLANSIPLAAGKTANQTVNERPQLILQLGHAAHISYVCISPNGELALTGSADNTVLLWEVKSGREIRRFDGYLAAFSPDNKFVLTAKDKETTAYLWDIGTGKQVRQFPGHFKGVGVSSLAFSQDGRYVVTGSYRSVRLWATSTGKELRSFQAGSGAVVSIAMSPDNRLVSVADWGKVVHLYDTTTGEEVRSLTGHNGGVVSAVFSYDGRFLLTGSDDKTARLWNVLAGTQVRTFEGHKDRVNCVAFSRDGRFVLTGSDDRSAMMWSLTGTLALRHFEAGNRVLAVALSPDSSLLLTGGSDALARLWSTKTGTVIQMFEGEADHISSLAFSKDGRSVLIGSGNTAKLWSLNTSEEVRRFFGHTGAVTSLVFSPDDRLALTGSTDKTARLWNVSTGAELRKFEGHTSAITSVAFSPDGHYVLTGSADNTIRLWDATTGAKLGRFEGIGEYVSCVTFAPNGPYILAGSGAMPTVAQLWDLSTGKERWRFEGHVHEITSLAFSPDGRYVLTGSRDGSSALLESDTGKLVYRFELNSGRVEAVSFSPDGRFALTGTEDGTVRLWNISTRKEERQYKGHSQPVLAVTFSQDGRLILTGGYDSTARIWKADSENELCRLVSLRDGSWVVADKDGRFDTNNLEAIHGLHWLFPDAPLNPVPPDVFLRDYYEPQLLTRLLSRDGKRPLRPLRSLSSLNRVQPEVQILSVEPENDRTDLVSVAVQIESKKGLFRRGNGKIARYSGGYDLRLFRDGHLVAQSPSPPQNDSKEPVVKNDDIMSWRRQHQIKFTAKTNQQVVILKDIRLPQGKAGQAEFTAYAFNDDRVKSETSRPYFYPIKKRTTVSKPRAYIITAGIDGNDLDPTWNLDFATGSARAVRRLLQERLPVEYDQVNIPLLSVLEPDSPRIALNHAMRKHFEAVFDLLAGHEVSEELRREVDEKNQIRRATPDDLVFLFVSSHGYADPQGNFYIVPSHTGEPLGITEDILNKCMLHPDRSHECADAKTFMAHLISSDHLTRWWRDIDAGEIVMILDSCHSASVPGRQFRPGPLGDRGFGQLSYDKGMIILAATQPDKTARATILTGTGHSLLAAALLDSSVLDGHLVTREWLHKTEQRVPELFKQFYPGIKQENIQYPVLFDFSKRNSDVASR